MKRRTYAVSFAVLVTAVLAWWQSDHVWPAGIGAVAWLAMTLPRLRNIGWPWWFSLVGLAPGGVAALSLPSLLAPAGYAAQPPNRKLMAASGIMLIVFGWLQVAAVFTLLHPPGHVEVAQCPTAVPPPGVEPLGRRFLPTELVPSPPPAPPRQSASVTGDETQLYLTFAKAVYPELADPHSPLGQAAKEVAGERVRRSSSKSAPQQPGAPLTMAIEAARRSGVKAKNFADIHTAQGVPVQVLAIYKRREDPHIMAFYGLNADDTAWALSQSELASQIQRGIRSFFSQRAGHPVNVVVVQRSSEGNDYKATSGGEELDNLLALPNLAAP